jgi:F-type H+-transporting ATPase subunit b
MLLEVNPGLIIWTIVTFIVLLVLLRLTAWKPILGALQKREENIRSSLEQAEKARDEAERILQENKKNLAQAEEQVQKVLKEGRAMAEKMRQDLIARANDESKRMIENAKEQIEREKQDALKELRKEVASLAIQAASKILDENLDENKQKKIIDTFIDELPTN